MKLIGSLSSSACQRLLSATLISTSSKLILEELGTILNIKKFKDKAKAKTVTSCHSIYITIKEKRYTADVTEGENPAEEFISSNASTDISKLTLDEIGAFQGFKNRYVLPSTIHKHKCPTLEPCPICTDGKCTECNGDKTVVCDACDGSGECSACDGSGRYPCYSCDQTGECSYCGGSGEEDCDDCDGDGWVWVECRACNGTGRYTLRNGYDVECRVCHGSGNHHKEDCDNCDGTGSVDCHVCDGSGECQKCGGEGDVECRACHGTGTCGKCKGKAKLKCRNCKGSGLCPSCKGTQTIPCRRCIGSGLYQTFKCITLHKNNHTYLLKDESLERQFDIDLKSLGKRQIYNGIPYIIDFGKPTINDIPIVDFLTRVYDSSYLEKIYQYRDSLFNRDGSALIDSNIYVKSSIVIEQIPVFKCIVEYSKETFIFYIIGTDGKVFADKTPTLWDRFCAWLH